MKYVTKIVTGERTITFDRPHQVVMKKGSDKNIIEVFSELLNLAMSIYVNKNHIVDLYSTKKLKSLTVDEFREGKFKYSQVCAVENNEYGVYCSVPVYYGNFSHDSRIELIFEGANNYRMHLPKVGTLFHVNTGRDVERYLDCELIETYREEI